MGRCYCERGRIVQALNIENAIEEKEPAEFEQKKLTFVGVSGGSTTCNSPVKYRKYGTYSSDDSSFETKQTGVLGKEAIKIAVYGPPKSGKTTFCRKITRQKVNQYYIPSIFTEKYQMRFIHNRKSYNFSFIIPKNDSRKAISADCYFVFFDYSNLQSFLEAKKFVQEKLQNINRPIFFIGNKYEIPHAVTAEEIKEFCERRRCLFFEICALTEIGFIFLMKIAKEILTAEERIKC